MVIQYEFTIIIIIMTTDITINIEIEAPLQDDDVCVCVCVMERRHISTHSTLDCYVVCQYQVAFLTAKRPHLPLNVRSK